MKIALVHDYLKEYGGAERVLQTLHEMWPEAPIYTAFCLKDSAAGKAFADVKVIESWLAPLIKYKNLYSPLRFLTPLIWKSFNFSNYDLVITSASWYITRGFRIGKKTKILCYCHTPPRALYGYPTSIEWQRYWPIRIYGTIVNHFLRFYDYYSAQQVDQFIANSKNVATRIKKFYRRQATVIYPPVEVEEIIQATRGLKPKDYYLIASRVVGAKGIELAAEAAEKAKVNLKILGEPAGLRWFGGKLEGLKSKRVEFLGRVSDENLYRYYGQCKAFLALATDEDFGMTLVEAMAAGRPVIAFRGGGYLETVVEGKTGEFFNPPSREASAGRGDPMLESLVQVLKKFDPKKYKPEDCLAQAKKFSKERFKREIKEFVKKHAGVT
jgi:glycosyltransferase involved in cell wall biosynthesis